MDLGAQIRSAREKLGWSQVRLAKEARVNQPTLQRIESGRSAEPTIGVVAAIALALRMTIDDLYAGVTQPNVDRRQSLEDRVDALERQLLLTAQMARDAFALAQSLADPLSVDPSRVGEP